MANTTVRDSGNNVVAFQTFDTGAGLLSGTVNVDGVTFAPISNTNPLAVLDNPLNTTANTILTGVGRVNDAPASDDSSAASMVALFKRGLGNWTNLLNNRLPTLSNGRIPVDVNGGGVVVVSEQDGVVPAGSPYSGSSVATLATLDTSGYGCAVVQLSGTFVATVTWEVSNDNTNWTGVIAYAPTNPGNSGPSLTTSSQGIFQINTVARYLRLRVSAYTSGTVVVSVLMRDNALPTNAQYIGGSAILSVLPTISANATGVTTLGIKSGTTTNATLVKSSAGNVTDITLSNNTTATRYVKFYNKSTAPVVGTDVPFWKISILAGATIVMNFSQPLRFTTGIGYGITGALGDTDTTVTALDDVTGVFSYV